MIENSGNLKTTRPMVLIFDGNSEHIVHALRKIGPCGEKNPIRDLSLSHQIPLKQIE
mgnify:CR=1 FL=1